MRYQSFIRFLDILVVNFYYYNYFHINFKLYFIRLSLLFHYTKISYPIIYVILKQLKDNLFFYIYFIFIIKLNIFKRLTLQLFIIV